MHKPEGSSGFTDQDLTELLQVLRPGGQEITPRAGFYARVMERVEAQQKNSIWSVFLEPVFSRRLAYASLGLMLLMGTVLYTSGPEPEFGELAFEDAPGVMLTNENDVAPALGSIERRSVDALHAQPVSLMGAEQGRDVVLVDLVSYR